MSGPTSGKAGLPMSGPTSGKATVAGIASRPKKNSSSESTVESLGTLHIDIIGPSCAVDSRSTKKFSSESTVESRGTRNAGAAGAAPIIEATLNASGASSSEAILLAGHDFNSRSCRKPSKEKLRMAGTSRKVCFTMHSIAAESVVEALVAVSKNSSGASSNEAARLAGQDLNSRSCMKSSNEPVLRAGYWMNVFMTGYSTFMGSRSIEEAISKGVNKD